MSENVNETKIKFCSSCGEKLLEEVAYCSRCGTKNKDERAPEPTFIVHNTTVVQNNTGLRPPKDK